ncbi:hypothetical protein [Roseimicrobium sp. ORNL1]|uniref:hypothetical protein n=1 Tax=Roseimicrobium sp. ORNL1 TaxID=2711231 RepID=UPI0013E1224D|nr:hypothetical protein [Roseimicrobium sp. ORNL1]QIF05860.1 hypothetical protein G5S37_31670 [Roseimicrobium sp. ORNL1]
MSCLSFAQRSVVLALPVLLLPLLLLTGGPVSGADLLPGSTLTLPFPQLPHDRHDQASSCEIKLPANYAPDKSYPLVVWLEGGDGGNKPQTPFLPEGDFVTVGLPFPLGANQPSTPHLVGDFPAIWKYHRTMLEEIHRRIPNLDRRRSIIAGFSNGAHAIDGMLKLKVTPGEGPGLASFFGIFILVEGGGWDVTEGEYPDCTGKFAYLAMGEKSSLLRVVPRAAKEFLAHGASMHLSMMAGTKHEFADFEKETIRKWLAEEALPGLANER